MANPAAQRLAQLAQAQGLVRSRGQQGALSLEDEPEERSFLERALEVGEGATAEQRRLSAGTGTGLDIFTAKSRAEKIDAISDQQRAERAAVEVERGQNLLALGSAGANLSEAESQNFLTGLADPSTRAEATAELDELQAARIASQPTQAQIRVEAIAQGLSVQKRRNEVQEPLFNQQQAGAQMITSLNEASGFGDIASIFGLFKFLDPGSRVTGSEVELSGDASTYAQQALVIWNQVKGKPGLMTPPMRAQMQELIAGQMGQLEGQMLQNNALFNEQIGAIMSGQFLPGLEQALAVGQSPFFQPDFELPEFTAGSKKGEGLFGNGGTAAPASAATPGGTADFDLRDPDARD